MWPGPDVRQVGGACTSAQLRNITLCSQLNEVHRSLMNLLPRLPAQAAANLRFVPNPPTITKPPSTSAVASNKPMSAHSWTTWQAVTRSLQAAEHVPPAHPQNAWTLLADMTCESRWLQQREIKEPSIEL